MRRLTAIEASRTREIHDTAPNADSSGSVRMLETILREVRDLHAILGARSKEYFSVAEFAELVGRAPYTIRTWIAEKRIEAIRIKGTGPKGRLLIPRREVERVTRYGCLPCETADSALSESSNGGSRNETT